ncbi:MAG: hypothetical protein V1799_13625, partial [bacterium]
PIGVSSGDLTVKALDEGYRESRMRENCTYGLTRGRAGLYERSLYSTGSFFYWVSIFIVNYSYGSIYDE